MSERGNVPEPNTYSVALQKKGFDWYLVDFKTGTVGKTGDPVQVLRWLEKRIGSRYADMAMELSLKADCRFSVGRHDNRMPRTRHVTWWHKFKIWLGVNRMEAMV